MADTLHDQFRGYGIAQVMVMLKAQPSTKHPASELRSLAAAIPVTASRSKDDLSDKLVEELSTHFRTSEFSVDLALAAEASAAKIRSAGANWYRRAANKSDPTPPVRYFPNLGIMLGNVDQQGATSLRNHPRVAHVTAPPVLRLVRPVAKRPVKLSTAAAAADTWGIKRLKADVLHKKGILGSGTIVGHLDTGADGKHPALKTAFHAFAQFDDLGFQVTPSPAPFDSGEHGTHTAGTIAGRPAGGRSIGMAPAALLASAMVIEGGNTTARILGGLDWVLGQGVRILSMSLGYPGYTEDFLPLIQLLRSKGVLPVIAVGNEGPGTSRSPGNYVEALSVGAMDNSDHVASFSSSRRFNRPSNPLVPDLVAPGVDVISAMPGGGYQSMDGTSMATPHIAGLAALLMEVSPSSSIDQIETAIFDSCSPLPGEPTERQNRGAPDAVRALDLLGTLSPASGTGLQAPAGGDSGTGARRLRATAPHRRKTREQTARRRKAAVPRKISSRKVARKKGASRKKKGKKGKKGR